MGGLLDSLIISEGQGGEGRGVGWGVVATHSRVHVQEGFAFSKM